MSKKKPIILEGETVNPFPWGNSYKLKTVIEFIGKPGNGYLRLEMREGNQQRYLGALDGKTLARLIKWCESARRKS